MRLKGGAEQPSHVFGAMAWMLLDKDIDQEGQVLARYEAAWRADTGCSSGVEEHRNGNWR